MEIGYNGKIFGNLTGTVLSNVLSWQSITLIILIGISLWEILSWCNTWYFRVHCGRHYLVGPLFFT